MSESQTKLLLIGLFVTIGFFEGGTVANSEIQSTTGFKWNTCGTGDAILVSNIFGNFTDYCDTRSCNLRINQKYDAWFVWLPGSSHENATLRVRAENYDLIQPRSEALIADGRTYTYSFPLLFDSKFDNNAASERHDLRVSVFGDEVDQLELCMTFTIYVNSLVPNNQTKYGESCSINQSPCGFANSICENNVCNCDSAAVLNHANLCKKKVGKFCLADDDCLTYGECDGECKCRRGYEPNKRNDRCSSGTAIAFSFLMLVLQQGLVLSRYF